MKMKKITYVGNLSGKSKGIYREEDGKIILGQSHPIFIQNFHYHLIELEIYADGVIDCWKLVNFEEFKQKVVEGWVVTEIPENAEISIFPLGYYSTINVVNAVKPQELIKEVADIIEELNNRPTTSHLCQDAYEEYLKNSNNKTEEKLRNTYEAIPEHNRIYVLGDMNLKDSPIRKIIYGE
ncbi:MAG: hypothetical protein Q7R97_03190 [Candidatus Daviesbacteria bacterium]|nr:hypothetical protein [Candidatus Daviesbacteria bacterium]